MKRRLALLPLLLAALPACARGLAPPADAPDVHQAPSVHRGPSGHGGSSVHDESSVYDEWSVPLRARLVEGLSGLGIQVNRPAHVALFEVVPGRGMGLMYPAYGSERSYVSSGFFRVPRNHLRPYTWHYASDARLSPFGPRYYLLVASRAPLRIERFQDDPGALRQWFGLRRFAALSAHRAMDELVEMVVPMQADEDWDTDLLTVWPDDTPFRYDDDRLVRVVCDNGYVVTTTWEMAHAACPRPKNAPPAQPVPPQRPDTTQAPPSDSVQVPTRRRPEPRSTDDTEDGVADGRVAPPRGPAQVERWRPTGDADSEGRPRRPHVRSAEGEDSTGTPVARRVPPAGERDAEPQGREREGDVVGSQPERPRVRPGAVGRGDGEPRPESPRTAPRREAPRVEPPRREPPREAPRPEPSRPVAPRPEPQPERARPEPARPEPARPEPTRPEPSRPEPSRPEPAPRGPGVDPR